MGIKLPVVSGRETAKVLEKLGYAFADQKGSHMHYRKITPPHAKITVPDHKELDRKTLKTILRTAELITEEFIKLL